MTYRDFLALRAAELHSSDTPFLDASLILAKALGLTRDRILSSLNLELPALPELFAALWRRRLDGESVAYILGEKEFFGKSFRVDSRVLVPRPDTEILVEAALETGDWLEANGISNLRLHDLCTGSGAVAISIAAERPRWKVSASDISRPALEVAAANSRRILAGEIVLSHADLLEGLGPFDMIVSNPPYVPSGETDELLSRGWGEPRLALDGGRDGLDIVRRLAAQAGSALVPGGFLLIETDSLQVPYTCAILRSSGFDEIRIFRDLGGKERVTGARKGVPGA